MTADQGAYNHAIWIIRSAKTCLTSVLNNEGTLADRLCSFDTPATVDGQKHLYLGRLKLMKGPAATPLSTISFPSQHPCDSHAAHSME